MFSAEPSLPVQSEKSRTDGLGKRIAETVAGPIVAAEVFRLKQQDKARDIERTHLARNAPPGAAATQARAVSPDTPVAEALKTAKRVTQQAVDAAHDIRHRISVDLDLVDSLERLSSVEQLFESTLPPLQDARKTLAGLKLSVEENVPPEATAKMNETFEKADRIVRRELLQTKKLIKDINQTIVSLKTELTEPEFDVAKAHPEIFSPIAQPFDYRQAGDLLMKRRLHCAGRALESATSIKSAPNIAQAAQFLSDYMAFAAAAKGTRKQLEDLRLKSMDPVLAERMRQSELGIKGTLHDAKVAAARYMPSVRAAHVARVPEAAAITNVPGDND